MWRVAYAVVLVASLAVNGYLLATSADRQPERGSSQRMRAAQRQPIVVPRPKPAQRRAVVPASFAELERGALERRLADAEVKLDQLIPLTEKFDSGERSADDERRAHEIFDRVLGEGQYEVECRARVCRLDTEISSNDWQLALFRHAPGAFEGMQLGAEAYLRLKPAAEAAAIDYVVTLMYELQESPQTAACKQAHPTKGVVTLAMKLDGRRVRVVAGGPLGNQPGGECIRKVLEELVAKTPLPPEATSIIEEPFPFWVP